MSRRSQARNLNWNEIGLIVLASFVLVCLSATPLIAPLRFFSVLIHECSHAIAGILTGGTVDRIDLQAEHGGLTYIHGGNPVIFGSAGYLGTIFFGSLFLYLSRFKKSAHLYCLLTGIGLGAMTLGFVSPVTDTFGFVYGGMAGLMIAFVGWRFRLAAPYFMKFLGVSVCIFGFMDIRSNLFSGSQMLLHSDAGILARVTGVPALFWAVSWLFLSVVTFLYFGYLSTTSPAIRSRRPLVSPKIEIEHNWSRPSHARPGV